MTSNEQPSDDELIVLENDQIRKEAFEYLAARMTHQEQQMWIAGDPPQNRVEELGRLMMQLLVDNIGNAFVWAGLYTKNVDSDGTETYYPVDGKILDEEIAEKALNDYRRLQVD